MSEALTEQEQIEAIKSWWKDNGTQVAIVGLLVAASYFGYNAWQGNKETTLNEVNLSYETYQTALGEATVLPNASEEQIKTLNYQTDLLVEEHGGSHYAFLAVLSTAAFDVRRGAYESAKERLDWALDAADEEADQQLVQLRYAMVAAQLGDTEKAMEMLSEPNEQFASLYAELRGDIHMSLGATDEALEAYETAKEESSEDDILRVRTLDVKIQNIKTGPASLNAVADEPVAPVEGNPELETEQAADAEPTEASE